MAKFEQGNKAAEKRGPNKLTKGVKGVVLEVFNTLQTDSKHSLLAFAKKHPRDFYNIAAKLIPTEVTATVDGTLIWKEEKLYEAK